MCKGRPVQSVPVPYPQSVQSGNDHNLVAIPDCLDGTGICACRVEDGLLQDVLEEVKLLLAHPGVWQNHGNVCFEGS